MDISLSVALLSGQVALISASSDATFRTCVIRRVGFVRV